MCNLQRHNTKSNVYLCCQRVIGCQRCISRWFQDHSTCPHCATHAALSNFSDIRGLDEMLSAVRSLHGDAASTSVEPEVHEERETESDSDFELPAVNFQSSNV